MINVLLIFGLFVFVGCQQKPTRAIEEEANIYKPDTVLVDTRSAFLFASSHIPGSVNLETQDYLILKNPSTKKRILDPDLQQVVERLARRGIHPSRRVLLLGDNRFSEENVKWNWLLKLLDFERVEMKSISDFKKENKNAHYADPTRTETWALKLSPELQQEFIHKKASNCFVKWSEAKCKN